MLSSLAQMLKGIKSILKKNKTLFELYYSYQFFTREVPFSELCNLKKIKLFLWCRKYSMNTWPSLSILYNLAKKVKKEHISGDFVECGCCNGGAGAMTTPFLRDRKYWLFDSFEGLPRPTREDIKNEDNTPAEKMWKQGWDKGDIDNVRELYIKKLRFKEDKLSLVKGLFHDTIPITKDKIQQIALLHLDGDWYESTKVCLEHLYDKVTPGGFIVVDDYGHWKGCKKAVDEFLKKRSISATINKVDYTRVYFRKSFD